MATDKSKRMTRYCRVKRKITPFLGRERETHNIVDAGNLPSSPAGDGLLG